MGGPSPASGSSPLARGLLVSWFQSYVQPGIIPARAGFTRRSARPGSPSWDHPRSRGVYRPARRSRRTRTGSSPLARGLPHTTWARWDVIGIIPARAGFTPGPGDRAADGEDHPRSRGVYGARRRPEPDHGGIIPARAGFTQETTVPNVKPTDHPRSRGVYRDFVRKYGYVDGSSPLARGLLVEALGGQVITMDHPRSRGVYGRAPRLGDACAGSSPLARGLRRPARRGAVGAGIIPARAGFTGIPRERAARVADHPRSRGVYPPTPWCPGPAGGSSPLARGLPGARVRRQHGPGIIPARAGFTGRRIPAVPGVRDHPRSRGVYGPASWSSAGGPGSSPLARGLHRLTDDAVAGWGIIPARAGFTPPPRTLRRRSRDHPRSRGVYRADGDARHARLGSSPLARGLRHRRARRRVADRIIPARAGFTGRERR